MNSTFPESESDLGIEKQPQISPHESAAYAGFAWAAWSRQGGWAFQAAPAILESESDFGIEKQALI